jgi:hypothetical protein
MKHKYHLLIGLILISIYGCINNDGSTKNETRFYWNQTKCADPWNTGENDPNEETEIAVKTYLENENVSIQKLDFDNNSPLSTICESCGCGTGQRIIVDVTDSDISKMTALNFYQ